MKSSTIFALTSAATANALQQCTGTAKDEGGNWFCGAVDQILYSNVGHPGTYKAVSNMGSDGSCDFTDKEFSGPMAPFNEELTALFRGPMNLNQFAVYNLNGKASTKTKRDNAAAQSSIHARRHAGHGHAHAHLHKKREEWVTATIDGQVVSWVNDYHGGAPTGAPQPLEDASHVKSVKAQEDKKEEKPKAAKQQPSGGSDETGDWTRIGYYSAADGVADGITFLGNYGGDGSGVFDNNWGNSLSYINSKADGGASSPQVFEKMLLPSNKEFAIYSDKECKGDECGYVRPGSVAYHGFPGDSKVFLYEFDMPLDGTTGFNMDMPAIWLLNAQIPRTAQYADCSCWQSDCGEFDVYEVLASGDTKCKSTFHTNVNGGSSDYFKRPTDGLIKVATVFDATSGQVSVKIIDNDTDFSSGLSDELVESWLETKESGESLFSLFSLSE